MVHPALKRGASIVAMLSLFGCSKEQLNPLEQYSLDSYLSSKASMTFCTLDAEAVKSRLKFIFIIDKSGSNQDLAGDPPVPGTDPFGLFRYNSMLEFLSHASDDLTVSYALVNFDTDASNPGSEGLIEKANFQNRIVNEKHAQGCAVNPSDPYAPGCPIDGGWTDYLKALQKAYDIIDDDIDQAKLNTNEIVASYYVVFMLTDGAPIIGGSPGNYIYQDTTEILNRVNALNSLAFGENKDYVEALQLHTAYYFNVNQDPNAVSLLTAMANEGNGDFIQIQSGQTIDFNRFSVPVRNVKHTLRDIFIENANTIWWDGNLMADSDGDALPDSIEETLGSNPNSVDSDGNGIPDGVEYRTLGRPCKDLYCGPAGAQAFSSCDDLRQMNLPNGAIYGDLDNDGLDDCSEKVILKSSHTNWDSNEDWIPDFLAYKFNLAFVSGLSEAFLDPDADSLSNYLEVKFSSPPWTPNHRIINLKKSEYALRLVSNDETKSCYGLDVTSIPTKAASDLIRVYLVENTSVIDDKRFFRTAEKRLENLAVTFTEGDFQ